MRRIPTKALLGIAVLAVVVICALLAAVIAPFDPNDQDILNSLAPPLTRGAEGGMHLLGTDRLGQDIMSRIIYGTRVSLIVAFGAAGASALIGVPLGLAAGFLGRIAESAVLVLADMILSIPFILLALVVMSVLGASLLNLVIAFAMVRWAQFARVGYALSLELREREYVLACRAGGVSMSRTLLVHVLPNMLGPLTVIFTLELAFAVLMESGLSFLGLGAPPETPSWGGMLQEGRDELDTAWWLTASPGLAIMATVIAWNFIGDWVRDRLDPRTRGVLR
jgi:peptide/nickel transport system permease protein